RTAIPGPGGGSTGPNLIGQFVEHPREHYTARYVRVDSIADGPADVITLTPRTEELAYSAATVGIAQRDGLGRRIDITENSRQRRTIMLRVLTVNRTIASREFRFSPTSGLRVVDQ